jgi:PEP-CTERM motif
MNSTQLLTTCTAISIALLSAQSAQAELPNPFVIEVPDFLIPLDGRNSTLDVFSDGTSPRVTGFNVLGSQSVFVRANSVSAGMLTLNLHLPAFLPSGPAHSDEFVESARLLFSVTDLDLFGDQPFSGFTIQESASVTAINGVRLTSPLTFASLLPAGVTSTDDQTITLNPIDLQSSALPNIDFTQPLVVSVTFNASATARGIRGFNISNGRERFGASLQVVVVPEPGTYVLLGLGFAMMSVWRRRTRP